MDITVDLFNFTERRISLKGAINLFEQILDNHHDDLPCQKGSDRRLADSGFLQSSFPESSIFPEITNQESKYQTTLKSLVNILESSVLYFQLKSFY